MHTQYCIRNKSLDGYLPKYKVGKKIDEYDHVDRDPEYEKRRKLTKDHGINVTKTNPDAAGFNINRLINQIYMHINESTKKQTEESTKKLLIMVFQKDF